MYTLCPDIYITRLLADKNKYNQMTSRYGTLRHVPLFVNRTLTEKMPIYYRSGENGTCVACHQSDLFRCGSTSPCETLCCSKTTLYRLMFALVRPFWHFSKLVNWPDSISTELIDSVLAVLKLLETVIQLLSGTSFYKYQQFKYRPRLRLFRPNTKADEHVKGLFIKHKISIGLLTTQNHSCARFYTKWPNQSI